MSYICFVLIYRKAIIFTQTYVVIYLESQIDEWHVGCNILVRPGIVDPYYTVRINISNYVYFGTTYDVDSEYRRLNNKAFARQCSDNISLLTASIDQQFSYKIFHLDAALTYQKSSLERVIPVPALNLYANFYLRFKVAHVLDCDLGADMRYFTKYKAPDYVPGIAQFAVQENENNRVEIGNYPIVNAYANFFLKHARFFVMMSHVNSPSGGGDYFLTPHYPINTRIFRFGVSWNFFN